MERSEWRPLHSTIYGAPSRRTEKTIEVIMKRLMLFFASILSITSVAHFYPAQAMDQDNLRQKYQAPPQLKKILDIALEQDQVFRECLENSCDVCKCPNNLPCYIKSFDIKRLENLEKLKTLMEHEKLDEVIIPEKYVWNDRIVAEELIPEKNKKGKCKLDDISKMQFAQIAILSRKAGVWDFTGLDYKFGCTNIFFSKDRPGKKFWLDDFKVHAQSNSRKIAIIDTKRLFTDGHLGYLRKMFSNTGLKAQQMGCSWNELQPNFEQMNSDGFWNKWEKCFKDYKK